MDFLLTLLHVFQEIVMYPFQCWKAARELNAHINVSPSQCKYVLVLYSTTSFNVLKDIKKVLRITKKSNAWLLGKFKEYDVRVEYFTLFPKKSQKKYGPTSLRVSKEIANRLLEATYAPSVVLVTDRKHCVTSKKYEIITPHTLVQKLLG